jgi:hypothetical protein|tara:strand:- start:1286 stop:1735 length:450 start_codon:yes stop_codon:yes gene_type:complete
MANVREQIAEDIVTDLQGITTPGVVIVSRNPINTTDLSIAQYPAIMVRTTTESREDATTNALRFGTIDYTITGFVRAESSATTVNNSIDTQRNTLIEAISEKLEEDRTRNSKALNSFVTEVTVDDGTVFPIGRIDITFRVLYKYTRGTL